MNLVHLIGCKLHGEPDRKEKDKVGHIEDNTDTDTSSEARNDKLEKDDSEKTYAFITSTPKKSILCI